MKKRMLLFSCVLSVTLVSSLVQADIDDFFAETFVMSPTRTLERGTKERVEGLCGAPFVSESRKADAVCKDLVAEVLVWQEELDAYLELLEDGKNKGRACERLQQDISRLQRSPELPTLCTINEHLSDLVSKHGHMLLPALAKAHARLEQFEQEYSYAFDVPKKKIYDCGIEVIKLLLKDDIFLQCNTLARDTFSKCNTKQEAAEKLWDTCKRARKG